jgi:decaprenylphospho-beta-D-ribofuranose 2-oxidase
MKGSHFDSRNYGRALLSVSFPKRVLLGIFALAIGSVAVALLRPLYQFTPQAEFPNVVNDVARLNPTLVREVIHPKTEDEVRNAVLGATKNGAKVTIAGKRHSMGGQTLYRSAVALDMLQFNKILSLDETNKILTVQSGATWSSIQQFLNPHGLAVLAMQGPNVFTVGGSMSVNAHGWDMRHGPVAASVEWFRVLLADGSIRRCSREENPELFHLVLGGYGLFGVILDVGLRVTDNAAYVATVSEVEFSQLPAYFENQVRSSEEELGEADLSISPGSLLRQAVALSYRRQGANTKRTDALQEEQHTFRDRYFFDLSREYGWGKRLRWTLQKWLEYPKKDVVRSRNNIFRSPIERIRYYSPNDTDILQEYFLPPQGFTAFVSGLRDIVEKRHVNLLDATVRYIEPNDDAFLNYSSRQALALVLYINVKMSASGREDSSRMTREILALALQHNGTFYLPNVLDYDRFQLLRAYPMTDEFFAAKRRFDPSEVFYSEFYARYSH